MNEIPSYAFKVSQGFLPKEFELYRGGREYLWCLVCSVLVGDYTSPTSHGILKDAAHNHLIHRHAFGTTHGSLQESH